MSKLLVVRWVFKRMLIYLCFFLGYIYLGVKLSDEICQTKLAELWKLCDFVCCLHPLDIQHANKSNLFDCISVKLLE